MPKVSVIIPVYGVEKYIERCARSLFEQTLDDMEFIFVDDCTRDDSIKVLKNVLEQYPQRKKQVKIIHHENNKGLSHARESGVKIALGEYIGHCDSDDWVDLRMFEDLYNCAKINDCDYVRCNYKKTDGKKLIDCVISYHDDKEIEKEAVLNWMFLDKGWNSIWCTLVKKTIYENYKIEYTNNSMLEDMFLSVQLVLHSKKINVVDKALYNYFINTNSISRQRSKEKIIQRSKEAYDNIIWIEEFLKKYNFEMSEDSRLVLHSIPRRLIIPALLDFKNYVEWNRYFDLGIAMLYNSNFSIKMKIQYIFASLRIYPLIFYIKRFIKC